MTAVKEQALLHNIPVEQPENLKDGAALEALKKYNPDLVVVVAYGHLITPEMLAVPKYGFMNLHASILPKYRGAAPVPYAILNNDAETGVTVFRLNERFDEGDILGIERIPIEAKDTTATILEKLASIGADLVCKVVGEFEAGWTQLVPQSEEEASRAPKMKKEDALLDWNDSPVVIDCKVRAYQPWPLCYTFIGVGKKRKRLCILDVEVAGVIEGEVANGEVLAADQEEGLVVACGVDESIKIIRLKPEGKKEMSALEFLRGARLEVGDKLG